MSSSLAFQLISSPFKLPLTALSLATLPLSLLGLSTPFSEGLPLLTAPNVTIIPTSVTRAFIEAPDDNQISIPVAVLDTGTPWPHPLLPVEAGPPQLYSATGEPPLDGLGHGSWCITAAFGGSWETPFGLCQGVARADPANLISVKCLSNIGFGSNWMVLQGMEMAVSKGARVVSMSLGGELQGSVTEDPQCVFIQSHPEVIFVVAAGNSGPDPWTVGSPGASPGAVTVGAWSTHYDSLAHFSSRGPNGGFYGTNQAVYAADQALFGLDMVKPDLTAPGGGPGSVLIAPAGAIPTPPDQAAGDLQDQIYSGVVGWTDGMQDLTPFSGFDAMRGTSMATPHAAGLIAWAVDRGLVSSAAQVKSKMAATVVDTPSLKFGYTGAKDPRVGYGLVTLSRLM